MGQLASWLEREKVRTGSSTLIITADADAAHGHIIDAMESATMAGVEQIDIETGGTNQLTTASKKGVAIL